MCTAIVFDIDAPVTSIDFDERGQHIISGDEDGNVVLRTADNLNSFIKLMNFILELKKVSS